MRLYQGEEEEEEEETKKKKKDKEEEENYTHKEERKETSEHYILHCPRFTHVRQNTIFRLPANLLNTTTLLQGDPNISKQYELINI